MVKVVELKRRTPSAEVETLARFVLAKDNSVEIVGLTPNGKSTAENLIENGIPGPDDCMLKLTDGLSFLTYLHEAFRGSRLWATAVFEMESSEALKNQ